MAGAGLLRDHGERAASDTKQKAVCALCHPNPGAARAGKAGETNHDDNGTWATPADVLGDGVVAGQFLLYYNGTLAPLPRGSVTDTDATFAAGTHSCSNVNCHNQVATPTGGDQLERPAGLDTTSCAAIQCHSTPAASGGAHDALRRGERGTTPARSATCAGDAAARQRAGQPGLDGGPRERRGRLLRPRRDPARSAGTTTFTPAYDGAVPQCRPAATSTATGTSPAGSRRTAALERRRRRCGTCHNATSATLTNGSHPTHFDAIYGPTWLRVRDLPHGQPVTDATHVDGTKNFETRTTAANPAATNLAGTEVCNACHGIVTYDAEVIKANWPDAAANTYTTGSGNSDVTCESCHGGGDTPAWQNVNATGARAPAQAAYFATSGHGLRPARPIRARRTRAPGRAASVATRRLRRTSAAPSGRTG